MKCPECNSINIKTDAMYGNEHFFQCKKCKALFLNSSGTTTLPYLKKNRGVSQTQKIVKRRKMAEFKYLGKKSEDFIEKFVELPLVRDAKYELNELLKEMFERSKEVFKEKLKKEIENGC